jgi:hypothetical protein
MLIARSEEDDWYPGLTQMGGRAEIELPEGRLPASSSTVGNGLIIEVRV